MMDDIKKCLIVGLPNAGKSTYIVSIQQTPYCENC